MPSLTSHGTTVKRWKSESTAFVPLLSQVTSVSLSTSKGTYEITSLGDTAWKAFIADLYEFELTVEFNYDPSAHSDTAGWFFDEYEGSTAETLSVEWPLEDNGVADDTYQRLEFEAFLTGFDIGASVGDRQTISITFKGTSDIEETVVTP